MSGYGFSAVVIPAFNAAASIRDVVRKCKNVIETVIVVDDGSEDWTSIEAEKAGAVVIRHEKNRGKGAAILTGLEHVKSLGLDTAVTLDADGQHDAAFIPDLLKAYGQGESAIVLGARSNMHDDAVPGSSRTGLCISNFWVRLETGLKLTDTQTGMRVYPVDEILSMDFKSMRFGWEIEVLAKAAWKGIEIREAEIEVQYSNQISERRRFRAFRDNLFISFVHAWLVLMKLTGHSRVHGKSPSGKEKSWSGKSRGSMSAHRMLDLMAGTWLVELFSWPVTLWYVLRLGPERTAALDYWKKLYPYSGYVERFFNVWEQFRNQGFILTDRIWATRHPDRVILTGTRKGEKNLQCVHEEGRGIIALTAHMGGWALAASFLSKMNIPVVVAMYEADEPSMQEFFDELRQKESVEVINLADPAASVELLNALRDNKIVCMMGDRIASEERSVEVSILSERAVIPGGPYWLAAVSRAPVMGVFVTRQGRGAYAFDVSEPFYVKKGNRLETGKSVKAAAARFASMMETNMRYAPHQWFNFYDFWAAPDEN